MRRLEIVSRRTYLQGLFLATLAPVCWSLGPVFMRSTDSPTWTVVFWRALFLSITLAVVLTWRYGRKVPAIIYRIGWPGVIGGVALASASTTYVVALGMTTAANALVMQSTVPIFAALLGRMILGERVPGRTWIALVAVAVGISLMMSDGFAAGGTAGDLLALLTAFCFASNVIAVRYSQNIDMVPSVFLSGIFAVAIALLVGWPVTASGRDVGILAFLGVVQLALGFLFFTRGAQLLPAAEAGILPLLESVLGSIWVWIFLGENPGTNSLIGGAIVIGAVALNAWAAARGAAAIERNRLAALPDDPALRYARPGSDQKNG